MKKINLFILAMLVGIISQAQSLAVTASVIQNVSCYGGSNGLATCSPSGGTAPYTYLWLAGGQTTQPAANLVAATYTVRVTDHIGNTATATATVTQPATPLSITATAKYSSVCALQSDSLFASGSGGTIPYSYLWNGPFADISNPTAQNTNAYPYGAAYVVTAVNDANGCTASASVSITVHPLPLVSITGPLSPVTSFNNDTLVAISPGASSYLWSNSATTSAIIVSPVVTTTYSLTTTNIYGCTDTNHYTVTPNSSGTGKTSGTAIVVSPSTNITTISYSSGDSVVWFSFVAADSNNQIIANSNYLSEPVPHVHRLTLYDNSLHMIVDEFMPDITGANQIRIDISHLHPGSSYYVRASRCPAHANMAGCNPSSGGECNPSQRWDFQMCFRTVPVFVPDDSGSETPAISQLYYEHRGQITDLNNIPRFDIKAYTNNTKPAVFASDSAISFVYQHTDTAKSFVDTFQRVDMVLTGANVQPSQPVFKMQEDSNAGYLNYFFNYTLNGIPKVEGYSRLVYSNVYPNISMQFFSNSDGPKVYFICSPGAGGLPGGNPADIELQFKGATSVNVTGSGGLNIVTELGTLSFAPGYAYTDSAGIIKPKSWQPYFVAVNSNTVKFNTGAYNSAEPLIIRFDKGHKATPSYSPQQNLDWSTYFGGTDDHNEFNDVCSDASGNVYAVGETSSNFYPVTANAVQTQRNNLLVDYENAAVAKFSNSDSDKRIWASYYGGDLQTYGYGIALDGPGNVYITGLTYSFFLPKPTNPSSLNNYTQSQLSQGFNGNSDAFIAMFTNDGTQTHWTTYYGGIDKEQANHAVVDGNNNLYIVGGTVYPGVNSYLPIKKSAHAGAYIDSTYGRGFIAEFNVSNPSSGITMEWSTRIGDTNHILNSNFSTATLYGCAVDAKNNFYVVGTASDHGYTMPAGLTFPYRGDSAIQQENAVVTRFNSNNNIVWSSYYGGNGGGDEGRAITVDKSGNAYITGITTSDSSQHGIGIETKPLNNGYFQRNLGDTMYETPNAFIAEFDSTGNQLWGTYFGGSSKLVGTAIKVDAFYNLYMTGYEYGTGMPLPSPNPFGVYDQRTYVGGQTSYNSFIADFATAAVVPDYTWGTYFGNDEGTGLTLTHVGNDYWLYMVGNLGNGNTPLVDPAGSYFQSPYYFTATPTDYGTSFISLFNIDPIVGSAGVSSINNPATEMLVYPNPTTQNIMMQLSLPETERVNIVLFNLLGEVVFTENIEGQQGIFQKQIPMSSLPNATYILKAEAKDKVYYNKITKLR